MQKGVIDEVGEFHDVDEHCHGNGDQDECVALDEQMEVKLSKSTGKILKRMSRNYNGVQSVYPLIRDE